MIHGSIVAIVTPFKNGKVDIKSLQNLIEFQIKNGTHGIVPCGTTGESPTLSHEEHEYVIEVTVKTVKKRIPVIAGTGSNSTDEAIRLTKFAERVGADAVLLVVPYYNKPTHEGLLYLCGMDFILLSGEDALNFPLLAIGGKGFITVTANVAPRDVAELYNSYVRGEFNQARELHYKLFPLNEAMFLETNPIPVKVALALMGKIQNEFRLPLCPMSAENLEKLKTALKEYGLIN